MSFPKRYCQGFLHYNQCTKTLHWSHTMPWYRDFIFSLLMGGSIFPTLINTSLQKCVTAFTQKIILQHPIKTHTRVKPYSCWHCEKAFTIGSALRRHDLKAHTVILSIWLRSEKTSICICEYETCNTKNIVLLELAKLNSGCFHL